MHFNYFDYSSGFKKVKKMKFHTLKIDLKNIHSEFSDYMAHHSCPLCGSENFEVVHSLRDLQFFTDDSSQSKRVDIDDVACTDCWLCYKNPCFTQKGFEVLFAECGASYGATEGRQSEQIAWLSDRDMLAPGTKMLDVGCYDGLFLSALPDTITCMGVDIDQPAINRGNARDPKLKLTYGSFENFSPTESPDVIFMFHVLEHVNNPAKVLARLKEISNQSARLVIEVPIVEGGTTNDLNGFFSTQHLTHFSRHTLYKMLEKGGWEVIEGQVMDGYNGFRLVATHSLSEPLKEFFLLKDDLVYLKNVLDKSESVKKEIQQLITELPETGPLVIWGAGMHTELLFQLTDLFACEGRSFHLVDSDPMKIGKTWRGIPISHPSSVCDVNWLDSGARLVTSTYGNQFEIVKAAIKWGVPENQICTFYGEVNVY